MSIYTLSRRYFNDIRLLRHYRLDVIDMEKHLKGLGERRKSLTSDYLDRIKSVWLPYGVKEYGWHEYFSSISGNESPYYIPPFVWLDRLCEPLNRMVEHKHHLLDDKNYLDLLFPNLSMPDTIVRNINGELLNKSFKPISIEEACKLCLDNDEIVIKPDMK